MDYPEPASAAVARTIYDGRVWVDCGATIPLGYLSASVKTLPPLYIFIYGNSTLSMELTLLVEWSYGSSIYKERKDNRSHLAQNHLTVALYSLCFLFFFHPSSPFISIGSYEKVMMCLLILVRYKKDIMNLRPRERSDLIQLDLLPNR